MTTRQLIWTVALVVNVVTFNIAQNLGAVIGGVVSIGVIVATRGEA